MRGRLLQGEKPVEITIAGSHITTVTDVNNAPPCWVVPGLVDMQVNGLRGLDFNSDDLKESDVTAIMAEEWRRGVTAVVPTLVTGPEERICAALATIARARQSDELLARAIPCVHIEGPYIAPEPGPRGAHDERYIRPPDLGELERWQVAGGDLVGLVTIAPEVQGALGYIRDAVARNVRVAIGHSGANEVQVARAVDAGASISTHLGNGCAPLLPRHPNLLWAQLADQRLWASFIADGHHLSAATFRAMARCKGLSRSVLVSDSVALAGSEPGRYLGTPVGEDVTLTPDGRLELTGTQLLAGSASTLPECVAWAVAHSDCSLEDAVLMATRNPCAALGLEDRGTIKVGATADLSIFEADGLEAGEDGAAMHVDAVVVAGKLVSPVSATTSVTER